MKETTGLVARLSSDYFESLIERRKRLEAIGWISGYRAWSFYKYLFFGHLQPGVHKNSEDPAILISELDDVMVKTHMGRYTLIN